MLWSLLATALASDAIWIIDAADVTTSAPVVMGSPKDLEVSQPDPDCGVLVTLNTSGDLDYLPTTGCGDVKLFDAMRDAASAVTYTWHTPSAENPDAVILMGLVWPSDETQPITLTPRRAVVGTFDPPAKYVGAAKKLSPDQRHCTMDVHVLRAGVGQIDHFIECDAVIQKAVAPAFDAWAWKVKAEVPRRALHQIVRVDFFDAVPVGDGKTKPMAMVSGIGPRVDPKREQPTFPEGISKEAKGDPTCWLEVQVGADGKATGATPLKCHADLVAPATTAATGWKYLPANEDGQLVDGHTWVKVVFSND